MPKERNDQSRFFFVLERLKLGKSLGEKTMQTFLKNAKYYFERIVATNARLFDQAMKNCDRATDFVFVEVYFNEAKEDPFDGDYSVTNIMTKANLAIGICDKKRYIESKISFNPRIGESLADLVSDYEKRDEAIVMIDWFYGNVIKFIPERNRPRLPFHYIESIAPFEKRKSSRELQRILNEYEFNAIAGGFPDFEGKGMEIKRIVETDENAPPLAKFLGQIDDGSGMIAIEKVGKFRKEVIAYQERNNISSVLPREVVWKGQWIRFLDYYENLSMLPQDRIILRKHKSKNIQKFLDFVERYQLEVFIEQDDDFDEPISIDDICWNGGRYDYVYLGEAWENTQVINEHNQVLYYESTYPLIFTDFPMPNKDAPILTIIAKSESFHPQPC